MIQALRKLYSLLDARERKRGLLVFLLLLVVAFVEVLGVASVMPFIAVLSNPEVIDANPYLAWFFNRLGFESKSSFLYFLGLAFFVVLATSLTFKALGVWAQLRFSHNRNFSWSARLVGAYLRQPYEWFLNRHSANLATSILAEVSQVINGALLPAMQAIAQALVAFFLLVLLFAADPILALFVGGGFGGGYVLIATLLRRRLRRIGKMRGAANRRRFHIVEEAFGGIKDVKVFGLEESFIQRFRGPAGTLAQTQISSSMISQLPSFAMQGLLFGGMLLVLLYLMGSRGGLQEALPVIGLYAFAGYRLMPALQNVYQALSQVRFNEPAIDSLAEDLHTLSPGYSNRPLDSEKVSGCMQLTDRLELDAVTYQYPGAPLPVLRGLSLVIPAQHRIALVGSTGSGKTTTVDLVLGLLAPASGAIIVDGTVIDPGNVRAWQRNLGYVPQQIFLSDDTVAGNIAFGQPPGKIDMAAVERAAQIANLHEFVVKELPDGYQAMVGERGVRLSGGQRQRIGIARALYHDPDLLVMDEATSALDNITERAVMEAVHNLGRRKTVILIAHRLSTVRDCDCIYLLEHGQVVASGTYDDLVASEQRFRAMVEPG